MTSKDQWAAEVERICEEFADRVGPLIDEWITELQGLGMTRDEAWREIEGTLK